MDPEAFLATGVTSGEFVLRFAPDIVWDTAGLLAATGTGDPSGVGDDLGWAGDVELGDDGIVLRMGSHTTGLIYPFRLRRLRHLAKELWD